jgi:dATP pyrophosphohydrolase
MTSVEYKIPVSVLVLIHTPDAKILLLERADRPGFWQSVTGSQDHIDEPLSQTAHREVGEETGIDCSDYALLDWQQHHAYEIFPHWRSRYAPGVTHNTEHVFSLQLPHIQPVRLAPREHLQYQWVPARQAAKMCFSSTNANVILQWLEKNGI